MPVAVPILDLQPQIQAHWVDFNNAFQRVLKSGKFILGPEEMAFEDECANYLGVKFAVGLNSGTDALYIALRALNIGPGDEVITTPFSFFATAEAISHVGATPVFIDIDEDSFNLDPSQIESVLSERTKAVIPVHLFGRPCDMASIMRIAEKFGINVVEDCAQSFGAVSDRAGHTGSIGQFGCFSFFPTKNLSAFGDAGMLVTNRPDLAAVARMLRVHGSRKKYFNECVGYNSRLDEMHAAMLRVKLPYIDEWNHGRRRVAELYNKYFHGRPNITVPVVVDGHVFHQYTVRIKNGRRDEIQARLQTEGISTMVYYPVPIHQLKIYQETHRSTSCPLAENAAMEVLSLPIWPEMPEEVVRRVARTLLSILAN